MNNYGIDIANQNDKIIKNIQESLSSIIFILLYKSQKSISNKFYKIVSSLRKSQAKVVFLSSVPFIFVQTFGFLLIIYLIYLFDVKDNFLTLIPFFWSNTACSTTSFTRKLSNSLSSLRYNSVLPFFIL